MELTQRTAARNARRRELRRLKRTWWAKGEQTAEMVTAELRVKLLDRGVALVGERFRPVWRSRDFIPADATRAAFYEIAGAIRQSYFFFHADDGIENAADSVRKAVLAAVGEIDKADFAILSCFTTPIEIKVDLFGETWTRQAAFWAADNALTEVYVQREDGDWLPGIGLGDLTALASERIAHLEAAGKSLGAAGALAQAELEALLLSDATAAVVTADGRLVACNESPGAAAHS